MIDPNERPTDEAMGMIDGEIVSLTPEQHAEFAAQRNAEELYDPEDEDDDLSDLDELDDL